MKVKSMKIITIIMSVIMVLGVFLHNSETVLAATEITNGIKITDMTITHSNGSNEPLVVFSNVRLTLKWDATNLGNNLKEGDFFYVTLPENMKFPKDSPANNFEIKDGGVNVVANAVVSPKDGGGGNILVTFTNYVDNKNNIKGTMFLDSVFAREKINETGTTDFTVTINSEVETISLPIKPDPGPGDEVVGKWGQSDSNPEVAQWVVRINYAKKELKNVVITDQLSLASGTLPDNIKFIKDSFILQEVVFDNLGNVPNGNVVSSKTIPEGDTLVFSNKDTVYTLTLGNTLDQNKQYRLLYKSTYTPGLKLKNTLTLKAGDIVKHGYGDYQSSSSGGTGEGDLLSKIKIIKVDEEDNNIKLKNAVFELTMEGGTDKITLTTDSNGEAVSEKLTPGKYTIKEITAPTGYVLNGETVEVDVTAAEATIKTITNKKIKTEVKVEKVWSGKEESSAVIELLADDVKISEIELNKANNWKHTFTNLDKFKGENEIAYTVREVKISNYNSVVSGDATNGFVVTNTYVPVFTPKTSVSVIKEWVGIRRNSVTINLFADGVKIQSVILNESNNWKHTFSDLEKVKDGKDIVYTISEDRVTNYVTNIQGNIEDGFTVINTYVPPTEPEVPSETTSVTGTKIWVGGPIRKPTIELQLYRNGVSYGSPITLEDGSSSYTWRNLELKDGNGRYYNYTVEEVLVPYGYVARKLDNGTTVVNEWNEPPTPPITPPITPPVTPPTPPIPEVPVTPPVTPPTPEVPVENPVTKPTVETPPGGGKPTVVPKTGDDGFIFVYGLALILSVMALIRVSYLKKTKNR